MPARLLIEMLYQPVFWYALIGIAVASCVLHVTFARDDQEDTPEMRVVLRIVEWFAVSTATLLFLAVIMLVAPFAVAALLVIACIDEAEQQIRRTRRLPSTEASAATTRQQQTFLSNAA